MKLFKLDYRELSRMGRLLTVTVSVDGGVVAYDVTFNGEAYRDPYTFSKYETAARRFATTQDIKDYVIGKLEASRQFPSNLVVYNEMPGASGPNAPLNTVAGLLHALTARIDALDARIARVEAKLDGARKQADADADLWTA